MKLGEILDEIKALRPSQYTDEQLKQWVRELEEQVADEVIRTHVTEQEPPEWPENAADADEEMELLIPAMHTGVYIHWLEAKIDYHNEDYQPYNNDMEQFNAAYLNYTAWYNRKHMPITRAHWRY